MSERLLIQLDPDRQLAIGVLNPQPLRIEIIPERMLTRILVANAISPNDQDHLLPAQSLPQCHSTE